MKRQCGQNVATEVVNDDNQIKVTDLQNMVNRFTEELEALRLKHSEEQ